MAATRCAAPGIPNEDVTSATLAAYGPGWTEAHRYLLAERDQAWAAIRRVQLVIGAWRSLAARAEGYATGITPGPLVMPLEAEASLLRRVSDIVEDALLGPPADTDPEGPELTIKHFEAQR